MILTNERKDQSTSFVENKPVPEKPAENKPAPPKPLPEATKKRILNSTVRLFVNAYTGDSDKRRRYEDLQASGVIFNVVGNTVQVLTAAHNLLIWRELTTPPPDWSELLTSFAAALSVYYGTGDMTFNAQAITRCQNNVVEIPPLKNACAECSSKINSPCYYDLALITCTGKPFATYATQYVLGANYKFQDQVETLVAASKAVLKKKFACVQLGFGKLSETRTPVSYNKNTKKIQATGPSVTKASEPASKDMTAYNLHYRVTGPKSAAQTCVFNLEAEAGESPAYTMYPHGIVLSANGGSSAPGDSGGPLYAVDLTDMTKAYLLGVTTGSDMETAETPPTGVFINDVSTSVIPYFESLVKPQ